MVLARFRWMIGLLLAGITLVMVGEGMPLRAIWPSVVALGTVFLLRRVLVGLMAGAAAGALLLADGNPAVGFVALFDAHLIPVLTNRWNACAIVFTLLVGGFAALVGHGDGARAILRRLVGSGDAAGGRVQWGAYGFGLACFFDGLASSALVGRTMRPLAARSGVSGEKLSFIVDSTSSPVACVALVSTWIAFQLSLIQENVPAALLGGGPYALFLASIPKNFYCLFSLAMVAAVIAFRWEIGPMRAAGAGEAIAEGDAEDLGGGGCGAWRAASPVLCLVVGLPLGLWLDGARRGDGDIVSAFGRADAALVLVCVAALGCAVALACNARPAGDRRAPEVFLDGVTRFFLPVLIIVAAWTLGSTLKALGAHRELASWLGTGFPAALFPAAVFLVGSVVSFATGTSWGTMAVMMPLALPAAVEIGPGYPGGTEAWISATVAAVFSGAVFGDHCSPMSDTTIVSAMASGIGTVEHVRTQLPYALISAALATAAGFVPLGFGASPWACLALGVCAIVVAARRFGLSPRRGRKKIPAR